MFNEAEKRKGELLLSVKIILAAFSPILVFLSFAGLSVWTSLAWSTLLSSVFWGVLVVKNKTWIEFKNKILWRNIIILVITAGVIYHGLYFFGVSLTSSGNVGLIGTLEILTSFIFFNYYKREFFSKEHRLGMVLMLLGGFLVLFHDFSNPNIGDIVLVISIFISPYLDYLLQNTRKFSSTETIYFLRNISSVPLLFLIAYFTDKNFTFMLTFKSFIFLSVSAVVFLGLTRLFWLEAIHRMSVVKANALSAITPFLTLFLAWLILKQTPTIWQLTSFVPLFLGVILLTDNYKFKGNIVN